MTNKERKIIQGLRRLKKIDFSARSEEYQIGYWDGITAAIEMINEKPEKQDDQARTIQENIERKRSIWKTIRGKIGNKL